MTVVHPERQSLRRVVEQPGSIQPDEQTELVAKVAGYVAQLHADIGKTVHGPKFNSQGAETEPGELLAELSVPELEQELKQKQAMVRYADAQVEQARKAKTAATANILTARAAVDEAKALKERWESESKRMAGMAKSGTLEGQTGYETERQFKAAVAHLASTDAAVRKAEADEGKAVADIAAAEAQVDVSKAEAGRVQALVSYTKIRAPYDGVVVRRHVNTGDFLRGETGKGVGIFTVARLNPVRVVVAVSEADAALIDEQSEATLDVLGRSIKGKVARTSWALEPGSRTLRAEIDVPNPDGKLRPGTYVYARITGRLPEAWTLPAAAVAKQGESMVCFLIADGKAVRTPVQVGRNDGQRVEVTKRQKGTAWEPLIGDEAVAATAAGLSDGQAILAK
ncbi:MAG: efflux RND transporter periplasmic adaptor subunit [Gemmataceae bacterium]